MSKKIPLSILMEQAKARLIRAFNQVLDETKLPAYLYEGMLLELLSEARNRKSLELIADINATESEKNDEKDDKKEAQ